MKKILLEAKSISDAVIKLTNVVGEGIINDASKQKMNRSEQTDVNFIENEYQISVNDYLRSGNVLTIHYIMYCLETQREYYILLPKLEKTANSEADTETNTIKIVSAFIDDGASEDFYETISHELEHLYQYGKGMKKREKAYTIEQLRWLAKKTNALSMLGCVVIILLSMNSMLLSISSTPFYRNPISKVHLMII